MLIVTASMLVELQLRRGLKLNYRAAMAWLSIQILEGALGSRTAIKGGA